MLSDKEQAKENVKLYKGIIAERLVVDKIMYADEFPVYIPDRVASDMCQFIEDEFMEQETVSYLEFDSGVEYVGVFFTSKLGVSLDEIKEMTIAHYI